VKGLLYFSSMVANLGLLLSRPLRSSCASKLVLTYLLITWKARLGFAPTFEKIFFSSLVFWIG
jgi:hypothetical protein